LPLWSRYLATSGLTDTHRIFCTKRGRLRIRVKSYHKAICYNARRSGEACAFGQGQRGAYRLDINQFVTNEQAENRISAEDYAGTLLDEMEQPRFICQRFTAAY